MPLSSQKRCCEPGLGLAPVYSPVSLLCRVKEVACNSYLFQSSSSPGLFARSSAPTLSLQLRFSQLPSTTVRAHAGVGAVTCAAAAVGFTAKNGRSCLKPGSTAHQGREGGKKKQQGSLNSELLLLSNWHVTRRLCGMSKNHGESPGMSDTEWQELRVSRVTSVVVASS